MASRNAKRAYAALAASSAETSDGAAGSTGAASTKRAPIDLAASLNAARAAAPSAATSGGCQ